MKNKIYSLLKKIEKITKTDAIYLAKGSVWMSLGQAITFISIILLSLAFANFVPTETYGTYKYLLSLAGIFSIFTLPGMGTAISRAVARGDVSSVYGATRSRIIWSLGGSLIAFFCSIYYFINDNQIISIALLIIGITLPFFDTFNLYNPYLTGKKDFKTQSLLHLITQTISIGTLILVLFLTDNVLIIISAYFVPLIIIRLILYKIIIKQTKSKKPDAEVIKYGKHLSLINILGVIAANIDTLILWKLLGPQKVAIYIFSLAIPEQIKGPLKSISELAFPKFAAQTPEQIKSSLPALWRKLWIYAGVILIISLIYIAVAPYIYKTLFPQYLESVIYSQVFMLASVALVGTIPISILSAQKKIKEQYFFSTIQPLLQIIAFIIFIPLYGLWGAIFARLIMRIFYLTFSMFLLKKAF